MGIEGKFPVCLIVPYNFSIYREKTNNKIKVHYEPNVLEETILALINEKADIQEDIEAGIVSLVDIPEEFLKEFRDLVWKNEHEKATAKLVRLFEIIKK